MVAKWMVFVLTLRLIAINVDSLQSALKVTAKPLLVSNYIPSVSLVLFCSPLIGVMLTDVFYLGCGRKKWHAFPP